MCVGGGGLRGQRRPARNACRPPDPHCTAAPGTRGPGHAWRQERPRRQESEWAARLWRRTAAGQPCGASLGGPRTWKGQCPADSPSAGTGLWPALTPSARWARKPSLRQGQLEPWRKRPVRRERAAAPSSSSRRDGRWEQSHRRGVLELKQGHEEKMSSRHSRTAGDQGSTDRTQKGTKTRRDP